MSDTRLADERLCFCKDCGHVIPPYIGERCPDCRRYERENRMNAGHDPDIGPDGKCRICGEYEPE